MDRTNILPSDSFYNEVAQTYNSQMTASDNRVREVVSKTFRMYVKQGNILDFGGGTGLDLQWEIGNGYKVFFLEPSENMRAVAKHGVTNF